MTYSRPWELANTKAVGSGGSLSEAYACERARQLLEVDDGPRIPEPLLDQQARTILVCKVLVPDCDVKSLPLITPFLARGAVKSCHTPPAHCCPLLLVHVGNIEP